MAVFLLNICKFNECGITFQNLSDLIQHIEDTHIDYDPIPIEHQVSSNPSCVPLSYVVRFFTETARRENGSITQDVRKKLASAVKPQCSGRVSCSSASIGSSEFDEDEVCSGNSEDSNDSWTNVEEFSAEFILRYGSRNTSIGPDGQSNGAVEKPFACPVPGCKKRYKNVNGIKYHSKNGHKKDGKIRKGFKCSCGKSYKTAQGLKTHSISQHFTAQPVSSTSLSLPSTSAGLPPPQLSHNVKQTPMMKTIHGYIVQTSQGKPSTSYMKQIARIVDADNHKAARSVTDNKSGKDELKLTIPHSNFTNLNHVHHYKTNHNDSPWNVKRIVTQKAVSSTSRTIAVVRESDTGLLTPTPSPVCSPTSKLKQTENSHVSRCTSGKVRTAPTTLDGRRGSISLN